MKNPSLSKALLGICTGFFLCAVSQAQEAKIPDYKLSHFKIGTPVSGEASTMGNLEGKVVVLDYWGAQ